MIVVTITTLFVNLRRKNSMKKSFKKKSEGFTLIELLVVIAIIGILTAVVLSALGSSREKAKDGALKTQMSEVAIQAAIYYDQHNNYGSTKLPSSVLCGGASASNLSGTIFDPTDQNVGTTMQRLLDSINLNSKVGSNSPLCSSSEEGWTVSAEMRTSCNGDNGETYCVDGTGYSGCVSRSDVKVDSCQ